ncbi:MAG: class I SAM-dependent methyltransferase [Planctomycetia bacterium]|nr:class I SAM-dependent methyltransferase [Planctomycetia bacterium]
MIRRLSDDQYRHKVREVYGGPKGAILDTFSILSGHLQFGERLLKKRRFDLAGCRHILDIGSGVGQIIGHLLKYADPEATITGIDLLSTMVHRAQRRLRSRRPRLLAADVTRLPFRDSVFDCVTCGYVLEHLPDIRPGLAELARVMSPGGRMLLFVTEESFSGAWTSRMFTCRTYNRPELFALCDEAGLKLRQELWFTRMHRVLRAGGICVELQKQ